MALLVVFAAACDDGRTRGGADSGTTSPPPFRSSISSDRLVSSLIPSEQLLVCNEAAEYINARLTPESVEYFRCLVNEGFDQPDPVSCENAVRTCQEGTLYEISEDGPVAGGQHCYYGQMRLGDCHVPLNMVETCVTELAEMIYDDTTLTCHDSPEGREWGGRLSPACQAWCRDCNGLWSLSFFCS